MKADSLDTSCQALPDGAGPFPGMVVIHEAFGLNDNIRDICARFAGQGYAALGVDLFEGRNRAVYIARMFSGAMAAYRTEAEGHFQLSPAVGDVLRISIVRNTAACRDEFTATNTRTHNTKMVTVSTPCQVVYRHAVLGASLTDISGTWTPPPANVRLWEFRNVAITSYNGTQGTICGPWPTGKHLAAPVITVRTIPADPSNSCRNFSVLLKGV
jgi:hypothetical protein